MLNFLVHQALATSRELILGFAGLGFLGYSPKAEGEASGRVSQSEGAARRTDPVERAIELVKHDGDHKSQAFKDQASDRSLKAVLTARTVIMRDWAISLSGEDAARSFRFAKLHRQRNGAR